VIKILEELATAMSINFIYRPSCALRIAYITGSARSSAGDAGRAHRQPVEFAGKILIVVLAIPILAAIMESIIRLLP
jgi:stage III sporulation protein AD